MLAKAVHEHTVTNNVLKPSPLAVVNEPRGRLQTGINPLKRTASQALGTDHKFGSQVLASSKSNYFELSQHSGSKGRVEKLHNGVFWDENDFEDDEALDLDVEQPESHDKHQMIPLATSTLPALTDASTISYPSVSAPGPGIPPPSSVPIPWSSSPLQHKATPPKAASLSRPALTANEITYPSLDGLRDISLPNPAQPRNPKRRTLPWLESKEEDLNREAADKALPQHVQEIINRRMARGGRESVAGSYTPLPKDKPNSPYPWNKTASAVKEEQKRLRQGHKKLVRANEASEDAVSNASSTKKSSVARVFLSDEQKKVLTLVSDEKKSVFFTGSAGTGKSVLLREIIKVLREKYVREPDRVAVTASTGLAACNVGGVTLHSFGGIGLGKEAVPELVKKIKRNQKAKNRWMRTKVLIVDEISMVDGELFDKLEGIARNIRNNGRPFGGIQLIITGDFFQLPPVPDSGKIAKFAFDASTWNTSIEHTIGLTHVFRQKDPVFANMLNEMRLGRLSQQSINTFKSLSRPLTIMDDFEGTELFPTRYEVDNANNMRMRNLTGNAWDFKALDGGTIQDVGQRDKLLSNCMAPPNISLKKGAQVMLIKNMDESLVNGSLGKVLSFMDEKTFDIYRENEDDFREVETVDADSESINLSRQKINALRNKDLAADTSQKWPVVRFVLADNTTRDLLCQRETWKIELPNGEVQASRQQLPLILAWALSIHKAQGQTLERVKVDLGKIFERGQAYVALSRATCQEGLQILRFDPKKVMAHDKVKNFYDSLYSIDQARSGFGEEGGAMARKVAKKEVGYGSRYSGGGEDFEVDDEVLQAMYA